MIKILVSILFLFSFSYQSSAETFMSAFEEIPLQEGVEEMDNALYFDNEDVRIIEQYISSTVVSKDDFLKFYKETLKSLGWKLTETYTDKLSFKREDEQLILNIESDEPLVVLFTLKPYEK